MEEKQNNDQMNESNNVSSNNDNNESEMPTSETVSATDVTPTSAPSNKLSFYAAIAIILVVLAGAAWWLWEKQGKDMDDSATAGQDSNYPAVVAKVNDVEISREDFLASIAQTQQLAAAQGADMNDVVVQSQIKDQALSVLINTQLLLQAAKAAGVAVADEQVTAQISSLESQYGDRSGLESAMKEAGIDEATLKSNIREQLLVDAYIQQNEVYAAVTVADSEVKSLYDSLKEQGQELPPLEEVADQIKQNILAQKQQQAVGALIEQLTSAASIEKMI